MGFYSYTSNGAICRNDQAYCEPGQYGPGGCFYSNQNCNAGIICNQNQTYCAKGSEGNGGCYNPNEKKCINGTFCAVFEEYCPKGIYGEGGCMYASICTLGKICQDKTGIQRPNYCPPGKNGPGTCYNSGLCFDGLVCKIGEAFCPGTSGFGGKCFNPRKYRCKSGFVCQPDWNICPKGKLGLGGCYANSISCDFFKIDRYGNKLRLPDCDASRCHDGLICNEWQKFCEPGSLGPGGCYVPPQGCKGGLISKIP